MLGARGEGASVVLLAPRSLLSQRREGARGVVLLSLFLLLRARVLIEERRYERMALFKQVVQRVRVLLPLLLL